MIINITGVVTTSEKGAANGVATLDGGGKVPVSQLPSSIMEYKGVWNATTNSPTLVDGTGDTGDVYRVSVAGSQNLGSGSISFSVGDYVIYNPSGVWEKSDTTDAVATVNGYTGNVTLVKGDIGLGNVDNTSDVNKPVSTAQQTALDAKQDTLVSGTNIKTINGSSLLSAGDISIVTSNIYTSNGTLTGSRVVTMGGNSLTFTGSSNIKMKSSLGTTDSLNPILTLEDSNNKPFNISSGNQAGYLGHTTGVYSFRTSAGLKTTITTEALASSKIEMSEGAGTSLTYGTNKFTAGNGLFFDILGVSVAKINTSGNFGIGFTSPTAKVHIAAGTATANTAPLKLTAGTNLTTPENGAFEFDGTNLYFTVGGVRKTITLV